MFRKLGAQPRILRLQDCGFDTSAPGGLMMPGGMPDAALVRTVSDGSFEAVTKRLGVLHALRESGVIVWNDARTIERCVDKSMTSFLLSQAGVPTPPTWTAESRAQAILAVKREAGKGRLVLKPLFGSQGRGLKLIENEGDLPEETEVSGVYYLQRYVPVEGSHFHDFRVFVIAGRAVAAMRRAHSHWVTNVKQGAQPCAALLDPELGSLALRAAQTVEADYCGVDIIRSAAGQYLVLEVNSMPAWSGLQKVSSVNIARELASALMAQLAARVALRTAG
jgi:RimK family alpha-L-glutamate ligase